jgi:hypothetical protein
VSWLAPALELDDGIFITLWLQLLAEPHTQIVLISQAVKIGKIKVLARKCGTLARGCSFATDRTLVTESSEARDPRATDETRLKHGSESKEVEGGPAGEAHAGVSRSPYDN